MWRGALRSALRPPGAWRRAARPSSSSPPPGAKAPQEFPAWYLWLLPGMSIAAAPVVVYYRWQAQEAVKQKEDEQDSNPLKIGGPFTLVSHNGRPVTTADFWGRWCLFYFGFTNCPEICPEQLAKMVTVIERLEAKRKWSSGEHNRLTPVFISIDPPRDSVEAVGAFIKQYSDRIVGLCGTPQQVQAAAQRWRVYYSVPDAHTKDDDYMIDHSVVGYLVQPNGLLAGVYPQEFDTDDMVESIHRRMVKYDRDHPSNPVDFSVKPLREWTWEIFPYKKYQAMLRAREDEATPKW
eukprot:EG_transcript_14855